MSLQQTAGRLNTHSARTKRHPDRRTRERSKRRERRFLVEALEPRTLLAVTSITVPFPAGLTLSEGVPYSGSIAAFKANDGVTNPADYQATIDWGDGVSSPGTIAFDSGSGQFIVSASHTYADASTVANPITATVTVQDFVDHTSLAQSGSVPVSDQNLSFIARSALVATEGAPLTNVDVAVFDDANPLATVSDFSATIHWGDGSPDTAGVIVKDATGNYHVEGSHTYPDLSPAAGFALVVDVQDETSSGHFGNVVNVADSALLPTANPIVVSEASVNAQPKSIIPAGTIVGLVTDTGGADPVANYTGAGTFAQFPGAVGTTPLTVSLGAPDGNTFTLRTAADTVFNAPLDEGIQNYMLQVADADGTNLAQTTGTLTVTDAPLTAPANGQPTVSGQTEGALFTAAVATFTDTNPVATPGDFTATIDWGDGTPTSLGTVMLSSVTPAGANFTVTGTHTYADENTAGNPVTVTIVDQGGSQFVAHNTITVADAPLMSFLPIAVTGTEGQQLNNVPVALFDDQNPDATATDFIATIDWGSGPQIAVVTPIGGTHSGTIFQVSGTHTFPDEGSFTLAVSVRDKGTQTIAGTTTATIGDATLASTGVPLTGNEGQPLSTAANGRLVATFTDNNPFGSVSDFTVNVDWGDGTTAPASLVSENGGTFSVFANHTYADEGSFPVTVTVTDKGGSQTIATSLATIADAPPVAGPTQPTVSAVEGQAFTLPVATFSEAPGTTTETASDFTATIDWGDGTGPTTGTIAATSPGVFQVTGHHTYVDSAGTPFPILVTVHDDGGTSLVIANTAPVADAQLSTFTPITVKAVEGQTLTDAPVATFVDANPLATAADFTATVDWGNGPTAAIVTLVGGSPAGAIFRVSGSNTFAEEGKLSATVSVTDKDSAVISGTTTVTVSDAPLVSVGAPISGAEGKALGGAPNGVLVATFTDGNTAAAVGDFTATVDWGDGTAPTPASLIALGGGTFRVYGNHTYDEEGTYSATVVINDVGGTEGVSTSTATIADTPPVASQAQPTVSATEGRVFAGNVASFTEQYGANNESIADFTATIDWGDGTPPTQGLIVAGLPGVFTVFGTHTYIDSGVNIGGNPSVPSGTFPISVIVHDDGGTTLTISNTANVADVPITLTGALNPLSDSGISHTDAITNVAQPNFTGTSEPFSDVVLFAQSTTGGAPVQIGQTQADSSGAWSITSSRLADGAYTITAKATDQSGHTTASAVLLPNALQGPLVIDTVAPKVAALTFNRLGGQIIITFEDVGAGLDQATLVDAANYSLTKPHTLPGTYLVNVINVTPPSGPLHMQTATLTINNGAGLRGGRYTFTARSGGITDIAGNPLDGEFYDFFPSGNNRPGGDFVAILDTVHNKIFPPTTVIGNASPVVPPGTRPTGVTIIPTVNPKHPFVRTTHTARATRTTAHDAALAAVAHSLRRR